MPFSVAFLRQCAVSVSVESRGAYASGRLPIASLLERPGNLFEGLPSRSLLRIDHIFPAIC